MVKKYDTFEAWVRGAVLSSKGLFSFFSSERAPITSLPRGVYQDDIPSLSSLHKLSEVKQEALKIMLNAGLFQKADAVELFNDLLEIPDLENPHYSDKSVFDTTGALSTIWANALVDMTKKLGLSGQRLLIEQAPYQDMKRLVQIRLRTIWAIDNMIYRKVKEAIELFAVAAKIGLLIEPDYHISRSIIESALHLESDLSTTIRPLNIMNEHDFFKYLDPQQSFSAVLSARVHGYYLLRVTIALAKLDLLKGNEEILYKLFEIKNEQSYMLYDDIYRSIFEVLLHFITQKVQYLVKDEASQVVKRWLTIMNLLTCVAPDYDDEMVCELYSLINFLLSDKNGLDKLQLLEDELSKISRQTGDRKMLYQAALRAIAYCKADNTISADILPADVGAEAFMYVEPPEYRLY